MKPISRRRVRRRRRAHRRAHRRGFGLPRSSAAIAASVGFAILAVAGLYLLLHPVTYRSDTEVAVSPRGAGFRSATAISAVDSSNAIGTYAEILSALDPKSIGIHNVVAKVRIVPASRAIHVRTESKTKAKVRPALEKLISTVRHRESGIADLWTLTTIAAPTPAKRASVEARFVIGGAVIVAMFGSVALYILLVILRDPDTYRGAIPEERRRQRRTPLPPLPPSARSGR